MRFVIFLVLPFLVGFGPPNGTSLETIGEGFVQNGLRMDIYYYRHKDEPNNFVEVLQEHFELEDGEVVTQSLSDSSVSVGLISDDEYITFTVRHHPETGGSEGFYTRTELKPVKIPEPPITIPYSMMRVSHTYDPTGSRETWVYRSERDLVWVSNQLKQQNLKESYRQLDGSVLYEGVAGRSRLQITATEIEHGTALVIQK